MLEPIKPSVENGESYLTMGTSKVAVRQAVVVEPEFDPELTPPERAAYIWGVENCLRAMGLRAYYTPDDSGQLVLKAL